GAEARVHEDKGEDLFLEPAGVLAGLDLLGESEEPVDLIGAPLLHRQEIALGHASTAFRPFSSNSASSIERVSGGRSRTTLGSPEVPTRTRCPHNAFWISAAGRPKSRPRRSPLPQTFLTPRASTPAMSLALTFRTLARTSSRSSTSRVASAAAQ